MFRFMSCAYGEVRCKQKVSPDLFLIVFTYLMNHDSVE